MTVTICLLVVGLLVMLKVSIEQRKIIKYYNEEAKVINSYIGQIENNIAHMKGVINELNKETHDHGYLDDNNYRISLN